MVFTILDQKDSYWQVALDLESSMLCCFNTPFGRCKFIRMPFGIVSASEILHKWTDKTFDDIPNVHVVADDMLIAARDESKHDNVPRKVLGRARKQGAKFNIYMRNHISSSGMRLDDNNMKAIMNMPEPTDKDGMCRLIGMLNYLSSFISQTKPPS